MLTLTLALEGITLHGLLVMLGLGIYATASHTLRQRRHPSAAIAWVISLVLLPYVALPLYLMFGRRKVVAYRRIANPRPGMPSLADGTPPAYKTTVESAEFKAKWQKDTESWPFFEALPGFVAMPAAFTTVSKAV